MKSAIKQSYILFGALLIGQLVFSQVKTDHLNKSEKMDALKIQSENKEAIRNLYDNILNKRKFEQLNTLVSMEYANVNGGKGVVGFQKQITELITAFPDAYWNLEEIVAEGNKVFVKHKMKGTHTGLFQNIDPTFKTITSEGIGIYEFKNGKIIHHQIQTDRLGFLQQLGILPVDISAISQKKENENAVCFIDKFFVPRNSIEEFRQRMNYNRSFIKNLSGFIKDEVFEHKDMEGNLYVITIAVWKNREDLDNAKSNVLAEYKRIEFNPAEFYQRLNIKMERGLYTFYKEY